MDFSNNDEQCAVWFSLHSKEGLAKPHQTVSSPTLGRTAHGARGEGGGREEREGKKGRTGGEGEDRGRGKRQHQPTRLEVASAASPSVRV